MIAEIPNLSCDSSSYKNQYRTKFDSALVCFNSYKTKRYKVLSGKYCITGVAFFDKKHGQLGLAQNGIEIHPVLSIKMVK